MQLNLLVLRCQDIEKTRQFYSQLGFQFVPEQHGNSPLHYSAQLDALTLELYPAKSEPDTVRLGFSVPESLILQLGLNNSGVLRDPDGRSVELFCIKY